MGPVAQFGLALTIGWTIPFFIIPMVLLIVYSLGTQDFITGRTSFGWTTESWRELNDPIVYKAFTRSISLSTAATLGCLALGYPLAYFIVRHSGRFKAVALFLIIAPFWVSFIVRAYAWIAILGTTGPVNHALLRLGLIGSPLELIYNDRGIGIGIVYGYLPLMVFPIVLAIDRIDDRVIEAAHDLGASPHSVFRRVIWPQSMPGVVAGCTLVWIPALGEYVIPEVLGGGKTYMIGNIIAQDFTESFQWPLGSALAALLVCFALLIVLVALALIGRERLGQAINE